MAARIVALGDSLPQITAAILCSTCTCFRAPILCRFFSWLESTGLFLHNSCAVRSRPRDAVPRASGSGAGHGGDSRVPSASTVRASAVPPDPPLRVAARVPRAAARCTRTRTRCAELVVPRRAPRASAWPRVRDRGVCAERLCPCRAVRGARGAMDDGGGRRLARCLARLAHVSGADVNRTTEFFGSIDE